MATVFTFDSESELEFFLNNATLPASLGIISKGAKFTVGGLDGTILSPEATDAIARYTAPTQTEQDALAVFVDAEVANGNWGTNALNYTDSLYDFLFLFAMTTAANGLQDMQQVLKLTATNTGATKVADGFTLVNGDQIQANYDATLIGVNYLLDDANYGLFIKAFSSTIDSDIIISTGLEIRMRLQPASNRFRSRINTGIDANFGTQTLTFPSLSTLVRDASDSEISFRDGVSGTTAPSLSNALPKTFRLQHTGDNTYTVSAILATAGIGFDQAGFNSNLVTLLTALGVLP